VSLGAWLDKQYDRCAIRAPSFASGVLLYKVVKPG